MHHGHKYCFLYHFTCSDKASLIGGSTSGFPFFENKIARVLSTDPMLSNLYILHTSSLTSFIFSSASSLSPREERSVWFFRNNFQADFCDWLHMKDVKSQLVKAWKGRKSRNRTGWEIFVESPDVEIISLCGCSRHHVQVRARTWGTCATRSNKTSLSLADTTMLLRLLLTQWTIRLVTGRLLFLMIAFPFHLKILQQLQQLCLGVTCYLAMQGSLANCERGGHCHLQ